MEPEVLEVEVTGEAILCKVRYYNDMGDGYADAWVRYGINSVRDIAWMMIGEVEKAAICRET